MTNKIRNTLLRRAAWWPVAAAAAAAAGNANADDPDPYTLGVLETIAHDSNVFRAPQGPQVFSDWISTTGLVGTVNQPIGRERLIANGEFDYNHFKRETQLDSTAHTLSVEGDWATVGDLSGELGYVNNAQLYRYNLSDSQVLTAKNTLNTQSEYARFHLGVVTRLTVDAVFEGSRQSYTADVFKYQDLTKWDGSLGLTYQVSGDLHTSLTWRRTHGDFPNYTEAADSAGDLVTVPDDFHRTDAILGILYDAGSASRLRLNVSRADEHHSILTHRSFSTWTTDGNWTYTYSGRTQFSLDFLRDTDTGAEDITTFGLPLASTDATRRTAVSGKLAYEVSSKILLNTGLTFARRQLDTAFSDLPQANSVGSDKLYQASLGFTYTPSRAIQLGCSAAKEQRSVQGQSITVVTYPYRDTLLSCTGQITFN